MYQCLHVPIGHVYISHHMLFHKTIFPSYVVDAPFSEPLLGFLLLSVPSATFQISNMMGLYFYHLPIVPSKSMQFNNSSQPLPKTNGLPNSPFIALASLGTFISDRSKMPLLKPKF